MASFTPTYNFGYFDYGEELGTDYAVQIECDRWSLLDRLLFGLMSVLGNGVISGWDITIAEEDSLIIQISSGRGNIDYYSCKSDFPSQLTLEPNNVYYIYAVTDNRTPTEENVTFLSSLYPVVGNSNYLLIGIVTTGEVSIETIDTSQRQEIDLLEQIKTEIRAHKHRGGTLHPSKIDLQTDVKNQLPSFRIQSFDADKISTGVIDLVRLPSISHNLLSNIGQLTHAQIEAFIKTLEVNNKELFGEVATPNMLQQHILMKYLFDDPLSAQYVSGDATDKDYYNEIVVIPGISPNEYLDRENSTAIIDTDRREIRGVPPAQGSSFYVHYDTDLAWRTAYLMENVTVSNDKIIMIKARDETAQLIIENFEGSTKDDQVLSDGTIFKKEIINLDPTDAQIVSESSILNVTGGAFSAKVSSLQAFRLQYIKEFSTPQDWSTYDSFLIDVKAEQSPHGTVKMYFVDSNDKESAHFVLLETNEVTSNDDNNGFETRIISLGTIGFSNNVSKIVIYTDDLTNPFQFYLDNLTIQRAVLLPEEGKLIIRHSSSAPVVFSALDWNSTEPTGTSLKVRARSANGSVLLNRSNYTSWLSSGDQIELRGTDVEIEITFFSDATKTFAPTLESLRITVLSDSETEGFEIDEESELIRGDAANTRIVPTSGGKAYVALETPIFVGSHYFVEGKNVQQIYYNQVNSSTSVNLPEIAIFGMNTPVSPNWILSRVEAEGVGTTVQSSSFFDPRSAIRLQNRNYLIADTFNDRILEMNDDGEIVNGYGSINYTFNKLFPIAASVDKRTGILYVVWSKSVPFKVINVDKISVRTTTTTIPLRNNYDKPFNYTQAELNNLDVEGQIMPIYLMDQNFSQIEGLTGDVYLYVENDVIEGGIDSSSVYYKAIKTIGIPCFVGNFAYKTGIHAPTYTNVTTEGGYTVANARYAVKEFKAPEAATGETVTHNQSFSDIVEIADSGNLLWGSPLNWANYSPFAPGRAEQIDADTLLIAGIKTSGDVSVTVPEGLDFTSLSADPEKLATQKNVLKTIFADKVGTAGLINSYKNSSWSYTIGPYVSAENILISDADINANGYMVVAESSFDKAGRIVHIDNFGAINYSFGEGLFGQISDINVKNSVTVITT